MQKDLRALIKKLDLDGLIEAKELIEVQLKEKNKEAKKALREEIKEFAKKAEKYGLSLEDVTGLKKVPRVPRGEQKPKGEPKYRNPANPEQTWTGHGRSPAWVGIDDKMSKEEKNKIKAKFEI